MCCDYYAPNIYVLEQRKLTARPVEQIVVHHVLVVHDKVGQVGIRLEYGERFVACLRSRPLLVHRYVVAQVRVALKYRLAFADRLGGEHALGGEAVLGRRVLELHFLLKDHVDIQTLQQQQPERLSQSGQKNFFLSFFFVVLLLVL